MRRLRLFAAALLLAIAAAWAAPRAPGQVAPRDAPARPVVLATSEGPFAAFGDPAASRSGWVVFHATRDDRRPGIYATAGGPPIAVAELGTVVPAGTLLLHLERFGVEPTVNETFRCAFTATFSEGGSAVLVSEGLGGKIELVANSREAFRDFGELAAVNSRNHVLFRATIDPPDHPDRAGSGPPRFPNQKEREHPETIPPPSRFTFEGRQDAFHVGLFLDRASDLVVVATTEKGMLDLMDGFAFNDAGGVAFRASVRAKHWSMLLGAGNGGAPVAVAETGARFSSFGPPSMNRRGRIAFLAQGTLGDAAVCRSQLGGGLPEVVADAADGFVAFGPNVAIDDEGRVAFVARRRDGREALWLAQAKGDVRELFGAGDLVGRRAVTHLRLGSRSFARPDRIALVAQLAQDVEAVVLLQLTR